MFECLDVYFSLIKSSTVLQTLFSDTNSQVSHPSEFSPSGAFLHEFFLSYLFELDPT